ncbi:MAG: hypothetical protein WCJ56_04955 [bacterium]
MFCSSSPRLQLLYRWHTPITGLYRTDRTPMHLWYPGGVVKDVADKIVWR